MYIIMQNNKTKQEVFWYYDITVLFDKNNLVKFFPTETQTVEEKTNAIMRFSIYISIFLSVYYKDILYMYFIIGAAFLTYYLYTNNVLKTENNEKRNEKSNEIILEKLENEESCTSPTLENPFMNFTMQDYLNMSNGKIIEKPKACDINNKSIKEQSDSFFNNNLYRDVNDVFGKMNSQRQFFTMPWTTIPPDSNGDFKNWLYNNPKTCKETQDACYRYEDLRSNRFIFPEPTQNPSKIEK
jgi:hypothetical protein